MNEFISRHGVRILAVIAALVPLLVTSLPGIPWEALAAVVAALLGAGEVAQRHEDSKTSTALHTTAPWEAAAAAQAELAELELSKRPTADLA